MADREYPIANAGDFDGSRDMQLFLMHADMEMAWVWVEQWEGLETAFEKFVEYLDDEGKCGYFTSLEPEDFVESANDLGIEWDDEYWPWPSDSDRNWDRVVEHAEADLTVLGWTTFKCGEYLNAEWGGSEVDNTSAEWEAVARRSSLEEFNHDFISGDAVYYTDPDASVDEDNSGNYEVVKVWNDDITIEDSEVEISDVPSMALSHR